MRKFQFSAVDGEGRICHGVMVATGEENARELLFDNGLHPKRLDEAPEETSVTWGPKPRRREDNPGSHFYKGKGAGAGPVRAVFPAKALIGQEAGKSGTAGVSESAGFAFKISSEQDACIAIPREEIELASISGFFPRILRVTRLDGRMHEFAVGMLFAHAGAKETSRILNGRN